MFYTPKEVEEVAYTIGLLKLREDVPENHICKIALYVSNQDLDGMINYYKRYIQSCPSNDVFKGILDGILSSQVAKGSEAQKAAIRDYFQFTAKSFDKEAKQYESKAESIK